MNAALYQIHTAVWLERLSAREQRPVTLDNVPSAELDLLQKRGIDYVWLMGVWRRSPQSKFKALHEPSLIDAYDVSCPGWSEEDVWGSPYAIYDYTLDLRLGKNDKSLQYFRDELHRRGMKLILDFVPNHLAMDHPWTASRPDYFMRGNEQSRTHHADYFYKTPDGQMLSHGRDPYFAPWSDTVQVNIFSEETREALRQEMLRVAAFCDGVRCDMAMLLLNDVFEKTWYGFPEAGEKPATEFWPGAIAGVKNKYSDFIFIAETYWDLEPRLVEMGFDYAYDKPLYDKLRYGSAGDIRERINNVQSWVDRGVHFIENHDEERAAAAFGSKKSRAAAAVIGSLPGMRFFYQGQREGRKKKPPIHLACDASEETNKGMADFYDVLFTVMRSQSVKTGECEQVVPLSGTEKQVLCHKWVSGEETIWVIVNYSDAGVNAIIPFSAGTQSHPKNLFEDLLKKDTVSSDIDCGAHGKFSIKLKPWEPRFLKQLP